MDNVQMPPNSIQAESAVLGALMLDPSSWIHITNIICEYDFYLQRNKVLFKVLMDLLENGEAADVVTVSDLLEKRQFLEKVGGLAELASLARNTPSSANIVEYAKIVKEKSLLRQLIAACNKVTDLSYSKDAVIDEVIAEAENIILNVSKNKLSDAKGFVDLKSIWNNVVEKMEDDYTKPSDQIIGLESGFNEIDNLTSGLQPGNLIILAGRPSMGKTALATNIAEHVSIKSRKAVAMFSMEMTSQEIGQRIFANKSSIHLSKIKDSRKMQDDEWPRLTAAAVNLDAPLYVDTQPNLSINEIRSKCLVLQSELGDNKLDLVVIDYIQLMKSSIKSENRNQQIEEITKGLKILAKDLSIPIIALSQLNRSLENRLNKRPIMSDLKDSGSIEQDADMIMFVYRDEVYNDDSIDKGIAEIIFSKHRNGALGTVNLYFEGIYTRFRNRDSDEY